MPITHVAFCASLEAGRPVVAADPANAQTLAPTASSAATAITANRGDVCRISTDTAVFVKFGANPTAVSGSGHFIPAGAIADLGFVQQGWKVAVITA